ncbi:hypothetical protein BC828DRAFT_399674 [Blastocladiella britannica]|nr:hypothetical protein BC828DRAFT_399674 [Blastocladiella britannica]
MSGAFPEWIMRAVPATDLELALVRRIADAALQTVLAKDLNAVNGQWSQILRTEEFDFCRVTPGANPGIEPVKFTCGIDGTGRHFSTVLGSIAFHMSEAYAILNWLTW